MRPTTGMVLIVLSLGIAEGFLPAAAADERIPARERQNDPNRRISSVGLQARWLGQDGQDRTGPGPAVGPDGLQDARIHLSKLETQVKVKAIRIDGAAGTHWEFGTNPQLLPSAELIRDEKDPSQGDLFFQPQRNLSGLRLRLTVLYENEQRDGATVAAGRCDPALRVHQAPLPRVEEERAVTAKWLGQDGAGRNRPGDVHVALGGLPRSSPLAAVVLSDTVHGTWIYRAGDRVVLPPDPRAQPMDVILSPDRTSADLFFPPERDGRGDTFLVRFLWANGGMSLARFPGGAADPGRRAAPPAPTRVEARPGDDLQAMVQRYGTVVLTQGSYRLRHPLVLNRPVTVTAPGGATVVFAQDPSDPAWTTAIKVHCGNTTLEGFAVRFEGPVRWDNDVSWGPALIGVTDSRDHGHDELKVNLTFTRLDLEVPPVEPHRGWVDAIRLMRLVGAQSGVIAGNRLRGGSIEFFHGPWQITDNIYRGTPAGTISHNFLAGHDTHDLLIRNNRLSSPAPSGKTWRFLVLTGFSAHDRIEHNTIEGVGARDDDTIPWSNEPEVILTESYWLKYEGKVLGLSPDGKVLRIGQPQGEIPVRTGDVIALLSGPAAGQWRRVEQAIDPTTVLAEPPIPAGTDAVSICAGFVSEVFEGNRIDLRGGRRSAGFILVGNHFGTRFANNHLLGGGYAFKLSAYPTEKPGIWGWSHAPYLGGVIEGNILEDCELGGLLGVEHSQYIKTNKGRTYMSVQLRNNVVRWSEPFLNHMRRMEAKDQEPFAGLTLGFRPSHDPAELMVVAEGNTLEAPRGYRDAPGLVIHAAQYNSQRVVNRKLRLSPGGQPTTPGRRASSTKVRESRR